MRLDHRRFWPPALLSLGLHGLVVAGLGAFPMGPAVVPVVVPALMVELIEAPESNLAAPVPTRAVAVKKAVNKRPLKGRQVVVKRVARVVPVRAVAPAAPAKSRVTPMAPASHIPAQRMTAVAQPVTTEASVEEPAVRPSVFALLESAVESAGPSTLGLSAAGVAAVVTRPLPSAEGAARMLRDTVAVHDSGRISVRMGNNPRPEYPRLAREAGWEGTVVLLVEVMPDGKTGTVALHQSSGYSVLDEAAVGAVQSWRFMPAMDGNFPIVSVVKLPVRFDLKSAQAN